MPLKKPRVAIIDYGMGNLFSVRLSCKNVGLEPVIVETPQGLSEFDALILPGVGAFGDAMQSLRNAGFDQAIKKFIETNKPFLGICLGMQLLMSGSEEFGCHKGLNIIPGKVLKFANADKSLKIPQVGWNRINLPEGSANGFWRDSPLEELCPGDYLYFVHSFYCVPDDRSDVFSTTTYGDIEYCSSLRKNNIFAAQFHPEKSAEKGIKIYSSWAERIRV
jgi:glutamine amidotransferase